MRPENAAKRRIVDRRRARMRRALRRASAQHTEGREDAEELEIGLVGDAASSLVTLALVGRARRRCGGTRSRAAPLARASPSGAQPSPRSRRVRPRASSSLGHTRPDSRPSSYAGMASGHEGAGGAAAAAGVPLNADSAGAFATDRVDTELACAAAAPLPKIASFASNPRHPKSAKRTPMARKRTTTADMAARF